MHFSFYYDILYKKESVGICVSFYLEGLNQLEKEIIGELEKISVFDCHEHLPPESKRILKNNDAFTIFSHYCLFDLESAGMDKETIEKVLFMPYDIEWKWKEFKPYYEKIKNTNYSRAAHITLEKYYGERELTDKNIHVITERIKNNCQVGLYNRVLDDCKIIKSINCDGSLEDTHHGRIMQTVRAIDELQSQQKISKRFDGKEINSIDDIVKLCEATAQNVKNKGCVGMKFLSFYDDRSTKNDAEKTLIELKKNSELILPRRNPLNEFVLKTQLRIAHEYNLVCCIHTGYWNDYRELSPANLLPFIMDNQDIKIDLYHAGYPYLRESIMLGKAWKSVRMNMCWTYLISQKFAFDALDEMLEMLPDNKIFGFGGDYYVVEKIFAHLVMARETIARVLAKKVQEKRMTFERAIDVAKKMLHDNPKEFYNL